MTSTLKIARLSCACLLILLAGCTQLSRSWYLSSCDRDIANATRAIESARDDSQRAAAYTERGKAYSEKARYGRAFNLVSTEEYGRLFGLAMKDHDQAVALNPASAEAYYSRGHARYDRASLENGILVNGVLVDRAVMGDQSIEGKNAQKPWFDAAAADFKRAVEKDPRYYLAWDRLGLVHEWAGDLDQAIRDYTEEMALNPLGRTRLADAYCARGSANQKDKKHDAAIADYEKSIDTGATADGCSCDPYNPLLGLYNENRQYDKAWAVVQRALMSGKWIAPELLEKLKKDSGRNN